MQTKLLKTYKNDLCANPFAQPYSLQKEATVTTEASEKTHRRGSFAKRTSSYMCIKKNDSSGARLLKNRVGNTANCVCGHKIEAIFSWKTTYPADGQQTNQISLCIRRRHPEDSIS